MPFSEIDPLVPARRSFGRSVFRWVGRHLLKPHTPAFQAVFVVVACVAATAARLALDPYLPPGFPYLTYFPAVLVTLIGAGTRAGIAVAVICGLVAWYLFLPPDIGFGLGGETFIALFFYVLITGAEIFFAAATASALRALDVARRRQADLARSRELMFSELQHRVSNNLATVAALLRMQAGRSDDPEVKKALGAAQQRLQTVARLQRSLHSPDLQDIEAGSFLERLAQDTLDAAHLDHRPDIAIIADPLRLGRDQAVPLGLLASELLMNAVEHGRPDDGAARISLSLQVAPDTGEGTTVTLGVQDNGPGLREGFDAGVSTSLGLSIARQFAQQLGGTLTMENGPGGGTLSRLSFPAA